VGGLVGGAAAMAFFLWRRDLLAMMVFHTVADATGLIIAPLYSDWVENPGVLLMSRRPPFEFAQFQVSADSARGASRPSSVSHRR
jgi:hypothetical protein